LNAFFKRLRENVRHCDELIDLNRAAVDERNRWMLVVVTSVFTALFVLLVLFSLISPAYAGLRPIYILGLAMLVSFTLLLRFCKLPATAMIYLCLTLMSVYAAVLSAFSLPQYVCVSMLVVLFVFFALFIDYDVRMTSAGLAAAGSYVVVTLLFKEGDAMSNEVVNVISVAAIAATVGAFLRRAQLESIDMKRTLTVVAYTDQLTGLPNRRSFYERQAECESGSCASPVTSMAMIDIDRFKSYNDKFGHQMGDVCLRLIGECFSGFGAREGLEFYRYGGEEFAATSRGRTQEELAEVCARLRSEVSSLLVPGVGGLTISVGISELHSGDEHSYTRLISRADTALYFAKNSGRNRQFIYDDTMAESERETAAAFH